MEYKKFGSLDFEVSKVGLGTWVVGGMLWGGARDDESEEAIESAIESGITLIDTAPVYGFGRSEELVGKVVQRLKVRDRIILATKFGLEWSEGDSDRSTVRRNSSRQRIFNEFDDSCRRLRTDVIDIYQIHWPDEAVPFGETMETLVGLLEKGKIRAIGLSNFNLSQIKECLKYGPVHSLQPPYNLYERAIEKEILPFCSKNNMGVLAYGSICRGLLTGKMTPQSHYEVNDVRSVDPRFNSENLELYIEATSRLEEFAAKRDLTVGQLAIQWVAHHEGITAALVGGRTGKQVRENAGAFKVVLTKKERDEITKIVEGAISEPIEHYYISPPRNVP